ncbi:MAG: hypothetical protein E2P04_05300, partial [Acidobacteria bacterium]
MIGRRRARCSRIRTTGRPPGSHKLHCATCTARDASLGWRDWQGCCCRSAFAPACRCGGSCSGGPETGGSGAWPPIGAQDGPRQTVDHGSFTRYIWSLDSREGEQDMGEAAQPPITQLLQSVRSLQELEEPQQARLFDAVYQELRQLARAVLRRRDGTLTPTALVHEA